MPILERYKHHYYLRNDTYALNLTFFWKKLNRFQKILCIVSSNIFNQKPSLHIYHLNQTLKA